MESKQYILYMLNNLSRLTCDDVRKAEYVLAEKIT